MHLAALPRRAGEVLGHGLNEPGAIVEDDEIDDVKAALAQRGEQSVPGREAIHIAQRDAQDVAVTVETHAADDEASLAHHVVVVPRLREERVDDHKRIGFVEPTRQKAVDPLVERDGQATDRRL